MKKAVALRRLRHDLEELRQNPLTGLVAQPIPENLQEWHANIAPDYGNFAGLLLHVVLTFPDDYPSQPPKVRLCTEIPHSNVIPRLGSEKNFICIDMLKSFFWMGGEDYSRPYEGWSSAYSVSSILLQVQCFLFDTWAQNYDGRYKNTLWDAVIEEGGHRRTAEEVRLSLQRAQTAAVTFSCPCGHCGSKPWPPIERKLARVPGIHLLADVIDTVHGPRAVVTTAHADGRYEVDLDGRLITVFGCDIITNSQRLTPWSIEPPRSLHVPLSQSKQSLASQIVEYHSDHDNSIETAGQRPAGDGDTSTTASLSISRASTPQHLRWADLHVGLQVFGHVISEKDFGMFVDFGGPSHGLLHKSRMLPGTTVGGALKMYVATVDAAKRRIGLSLRRPLNDDELSTHLADGTEIKGLVVFVQAYGCFVDIGASKAGLLHTSQMKGCHPELGSELDVYIVKIEPKLQLAMRDTPFALPVQLTPRASLASPAHAVSGNLSRLPRPVLREVLRFANLADLSVLRCAAKGFQNQADEAQRLFWDIQALRCFHTRESFLSEGCVLGVGVSIVEDDGRQHLTCDFDPLSFEAFQMLGVRKGVWRNRISYFLPLALDARHFSLAFSKIAAALRELGSGRVAEKTRSFGPRQRPGGPGSPVGPELSFDEWLQRRAKANAEANRKFQAVLSGQEKLERSTQARPAEADAEKFALDVLPKLMNSQVVLLMKGELWASQKALRGYMAFHHLLLAICQEKPETQAALEQRIESFLSQESERLKSKVPNLGEFICLLSASERYSWDSVAAPLLGEVFDRNVLWLLKKHPHLGNLTDHGVSEQRLRCTFQSAVISMRLVMFNVWFLEHVAKVPVDTGKGSSSASSALVSARSALASYNERKGIPPRQQIEAVQRAVDEICHVSSWQAYFQALRVKPMDPPALCQWLRASVQNSLRKRYHRPPRFQGSAKDQDLLQHDRIEDLAEKYH